MLKWPPQVVLKTSMPQLELAIEGHFEELEMIHGDPNQKKVITSAADLKAKLRSMK